MTQNRSDSRFDEKKKLYRLSILQARPALNSFSTVQQNAQWFLHIYSTSYTWEKITRCSPKRDMNAINSPMGKSSNDKDKLDLCMCCRDRLQSNFKSKTWKSVQGFNNNKKLLCKSHTRDNLIEKSIREIFSISNYHFWYTCYILLSTIS